MLKRQIKPELTQFLFERMGKPETILIHAALACVGVKETQPNGGPIVELFQSTVGKAEGEAWCLSFVQSMVAYVEKMTGVISPLNATEWVHGLIESNSHKALWSATPSPGKLAVWRDPDTRKGHIGIVIAQMLGAYGWFYTVEGNTGAKNQRDGDGVYVKERHVSTLGTMNLVGFLRAF